MKKHSGANSLVLTNPERNIECDQQLSQLKMVKNSIWNQQTSLSDLTHEFSDQKQQTRMKTKLSHNYKILNRQRNIPRNFIANFQENNLEDSRGQEKYNVWKIIKIIIFMLFLVALAGMLVLYISSCFYYSGSSRTMEKDIRESFQTIMLEYQSLENNMRIHQKSITEQNSSDKNQVIQQINNIKNQENQNSYLKQNQLTQNQQKNEQKSLNENELKVQNPKLNVIQNENIQIAISQEKKLKQSQKIQSEQNFHQTDSISKPQNQIQVTQTEHKEDYKIQKQIPTTENSIVSKQIQETSITNHSLVEKIELTCQQHIKSQQQKYGRLYTFDVNYDRVRTQAAVDYFWPNPFVNVTQQQYSQAVDLLYLNHHANAEGKLETQNSPCENTYKLSSKLSKAMQSQHQRLNSNYQIDSYHQKQLRFCIVVNSYNNAKNGLFYRNIDSILQQNYTNFHVIYTDDVSFDKTGEIVKKYLQQKGIGQEKIKVKINAGRLGMMENIYNAITNDCQLGEIAVMLDGDDSFIGTNVLSFLNAAYQKEKLAMMWNNFIQITTNSRPAMGFSRSYENYDVSYTHYRSTGMFYSSHLKSFFVDLFRQIKVEDLQTYDGKFYGGASDTAMMLSMIQMSYPRWKYVPEIVYEYRYDTGQEGMVVNRVAQGQALAKITKTQPYQRLTDFSFVDKAIDQALRLEKVNN